MSSLKMWKGKAVYKWYSAMDINGNKVAKIFLCRWDYRNCKKSFVAMVK